jgi:predicted methyltransferase
MMTADIHRRQKQRFDPAKCNSMLRVGCWASRNPPDLLTLAGIREGDGVLDLGCGPASWTTPIAAMVGNRGRVVALDAGREPLDVVAFRFRVREHTPKRRVIAKGNPFMEYCQ